MNGSQDNLAVRQAALTALAFNLLMVVGAIVSIMLTVPNGGAKEPRGLLRVFATSWLRSMR